jgi:hypothetical protein
VTEQTAGGRPGGDGVARALAAVGGLGVAAAILLVGALHVVAAGQVDPVRRTISEYALGADAWMFDVGVVALAVGSVAVILALARAGVLRPLSGATVLLAVWAIGMLTVVVFEKTNWSVGPSLGGYIHRYASLVAFLALPLGALLIARAHRATPGFRSNRVWTRVLALASLGWFLPILWGFAMRPVTGRSWWSAVPLGLVERGLALTEVLLVAALALWAAKAAGTRPGVFAPGLPAPGLRLTG